MSTAIDLLPGQNVSSPPSIRAERGAGTVSGEQSEASFKPAATVAGTFPPPFPLSSLSAAVPARPATRRSARPTQLERLSAADPRPARPFQARAVFISTAQKTQQSREIGGRMRLLRCFSLTLCKLRQYLCHLGELRLFPLTSGSPWLPPSSQLLLFSSCDVCTLALLGVDCVWITNFWTGQPSRPEHH